MQRAMRLFLQLPDMAQDQGDDQFHPLEQVVFTSSARQALSRQVDVRGHWQGGLLFGTVHAGTLTVRTISRLGPPTWHRQPLTPSLPYLLGWSDSLLEQLGPAIDWYGNWITGPDGRLPDERTDLTWLRLGALRGLFDDRYALIVVDLSDGRLQGRAYRWDETGPVPLDCAFTTSAPGPFE